MDSVDDKLNAFNDLFLTCLDSHAPVKTIKLRYKPNPFITEDIRKLMATRKNVQKEARRSGLKEDWLRFKILKREIKREICQSEQEYFNQEIAANKNNSSGIWKTIR
jgi:hypothetical protein